MANVLVLQGHFKVPFVIFYLDCTVLIRQLFLTIFNFFYPLTSFYGVFYILELFVDWAHNVNYWVYQ